MLFARVDPANDAPDTAFGGAEHLLLWACRRSAGDEPTSPALVGEFIEACGEEALDVLSALDFFVAAMRQTRRRCPRFAAPGAHALTVDEQEVLTLLAALQAGRSDLVDGCLAALVDAECHMAVRMAAGSLARAFAANGLHLHLPGHDRAATCPQSGVLDPGRGQGRG